MSAWLSPVSDRAEILVGRRRLLLQGNHGEGDPRTGNPDGAGPEPPLVVDRVDDGLLVELLGQILHPIRRRRTFLRDDGGIFVFGTAHFFFVISPGRLNVSAEERRDDAEADQPREKDCARHVGEHINHTSPSDGRGEKWRSSSTAPRGGREAVVKATNPLVAVSRALCRRVGRLAFAPPVAYVYNPLDYASELHEAYLARYGQAPREVLLLGMNPGPFG